MHLIFELLDNLLVLFDLAVETAVGLLELGDGCDVGRVPVFGEIAVLLLDFWVWDQEGLLARLLLDALEQLGVLLGQFPDNGRNKLGSHFVLGLLYLIHLVVGLLLLLVPPQLLLIHLQHLILLLIDLYCFPIRLLLTALLGLHLYVGTPVGVVLGLSGLLHTTRVTVYLDRPGVLETRRLERGDFDLELNFCLLVLALGESVTAADSVFVLGQTDESKADHAFVVRGVEVEGK